MDEMKKLSSRKRQLIFLNIVISCVASSMLSTALTTALPAIISDLQISVTTGQWLTSGFSLIMGIMMPMTAFLITRFPTRRLYLIGQAFVIIGLILGVIAPSFPVMMAARGIQAVGSGILTTMSQAIILSIYPPEKRGTAMGWYGLSIGAAPVFAPTLAGIIVDAFRWQIIFYITIVIMVISLIWAFFVFDNVLETSRKKFDSFSFVICAVALGGITLGIGNISSYSLGSLQVFPFLLVGFIAVILFSYRQFHIPEPFLELGILKNKNYLLSVIGSMLLYLVMMGSSVIMPLFVQSILSRSATVSGLIVLPGALIMALISPFAGKIYDKLGMRILFITGAFCLFLSCLGMFFVTAQTPILIIAFLNAIRNAAIGCLMMPLVTWGISGIGKDLTPHGIALLTSLRTVSGAIGAAVFVGIMTTVTNNTLNIRGEAAAMYGLNITFLCMSLVGFILLMIGVFCVKKAK